MDWNSWSGFQGNGTYIVLNRGSLTALEACSSSSQPGFTVEGFGHCPHNQCQVWKIQQRHEGGVYVIKNVGEGTYLTATGPEEIVVGAIGPALDESLDLEEHQHQLWGIDTSMCAMEEGRMVV
ncbi:MAG: hypothetical protein Q9224_007768, partial [Gallowayella concinna]